MNNWAFFFKNAEPVKEKYFSKITGKLRWKTNRILMNLLMPKMLQNPLITCQGTC